MTGARAAFSGLIRRMLFALYRYGVSPLLPVACRFSPTCSHYAEEAVLRHGWARGAWLAARRLLSCHPWHGGGHDPVPLILGQGILGQGLFIANPRESHGRKP